MTAQMAVLVVEEGRYAIGLVLESLAAEPLCVQVLCDPALVLERAALGWPDLVILGVSRSGGRNLELCRAIRGSSRVPILIIGPEGAVRDRLEAFDAGADDYVCSPFHPLELAARVRAILRSRTLARLRAGRAIG